MSDEPDAAAQDSTHSDDVRGLLLRAAEAAEAAAGESEPRLRLLRLAPEDAEALLAATATFVEGLRPPRRSAKTQPLSVEQEVHGWWALLLGYADARRRQRLNPLRNEVFAAMAEAGVIRRDGHDWKATVPLRTDSVQSVTTADLGAWVLTANPRVWDLQRWIGDGGQGHDDWTVARNYRSAMMAPGQRVLLWIGGSDAGCPAGFRAVGTVRGPCAAASPQSGYWIDRKAKARADFMARVELRLLDALVPKHVVQHHRVLRDIEVLRSPFASNPSHLSVEQMAALQPLLG
ncbi:MAG: EVE domain-containing protein [Nocardioides sp.]